MGSGIRYPLPWEADRAPERVEAEVAPREGGSDLEAAFPGAASLASRYAGDPDPNRSRRGAEGAARQVYEDLRDRGLDTPYEVVRDRVNSARARTIAKKSRRG